MNLLNIPKDYIPSQDEMILLDDVLTNALDVEREGDANYKHMAALVELSRKMNLLDGIFRAYEESSWDDYVAGQIRAKFFSAQAEIPKVTESEPGHPPPPTDENGSFKC